MCQLRPFKVITFHYSINLEIDTIRWGRHCELNFNQDVDFLLNFNMQNINVHKSITLHTNEQSILCFSHPLVFNM